MRSENHIKLTQNPAGYTKPGAEEKIDQRLYVMLALGLFSSSFFQGAGKGLNSLIATLLRTIIFTPFFAALLAFTFNMGQVGAWWGLVIGNGIGSLLMYVWAEYFLRALLRTKYVTRTDGASA